MNKLTVLAGAMAALLAGCVTDPYTGQSRIGNTAKGAGLGAVLGAGAGTLFGGNDAANAGWGALAGGAVGAAIGAYMDHQEQAMREQLQGTGIEVQRTAENTLNLTMPSAITFAFDSANLTPQAQGALDSVANVLNQYADSNIGVTGHTDDTGSDSYNQGLSERRAQSVTGYLVSHGVQSSRIRAQGMGERMPKYPNTDEANRSQNRRVELAIVANQNAGRNAPPGGGPQGPAYPGAGQAPAGGYPPAGNYPAQGGYPNQPSYPPAGNYPAQGGYPNQQSYPPGGNYPAQGGYPNQPSYPPAGNYPAPGGYPNQPSYPPSGNYPNYQQPGGYGYPR
jgi:outer membrane protein OmpA-like peptidoglycan-associated protein